MEEYEIPRFQSFDPNNTTVRLNEVRSEPYHGGQPLKNKGHEMVIEKKHNQYVKDWLEALKKVWGDDYAVEKAIHKIYTEGFDDGFNQ